MLRAEQELAANAGDHSKGGQQEGSRRTVAVKVLLPEDDPPSKMQKVARARFLQEVALASTFTHRHVLKVNNFI